MQDTELFLSLAEIAGVFVGFGALIAVRGGGASEVAEVAYLRAVVSIGMLTVVAALAPVTLGRFELTGHLAWALCSVLVLVGWFVGFVANLRTPEYRANMAAMFEADRTRSRWVVAVEGTAWLVYLIAVMLAPIIIVLGVAPGLEAALYFAVVVLTLLGAGWSLLTLVFAQRRPQAA